MDTAVALVSAYLRLNGYFVQTEVPILERVAGDPPRFRQTTDIDILAVRFPTSAHLRAPRESEHRAGIVAVDPALGSPPEEMDVIIGEVKEGQSRLNPNLATAAVLKAALWHTGGCTPDRLDGTVRSLLETGEARTTHCNGGRQRVRLVAFGGTRPDEPKANYRVVPIADVLAFLRETVARNHQVFKAIHAKDAALGLLVLTWRLSPGAAGE